MICSNNYLADILRVCEIKDLIWAMRFQSPQVYVHPVRHDGMTCDMRIEESIVSVNMG